MTDKVKPKPRDDIVMAKRYLTMAKNLLWDDEPRMAGRLNAQMRILKAKYDWGADE